MKAIQIDQVNKDLQGALASLRVVEKPTPKPGPGQVLIKIEAAPCNPSDLLFLQGSYGVRKPFPAVPGWEGAGTVVESGGGLLGWWLKGKRVWCGGQTSGDGTWAEYFIAEAKSCIPLKSHVSFEQGATLVINPLTAYGMVEVASKEKHAAIIQTAACSQLGRMVRTLALIKGIPVINVVRREEQVQQLHAEKEQWVLNSEKEGFQHSLKEMAENLNATLALDAVGGEMTGKVLAAMPPTSKILVYGALEGKPCGAISPLSLIFERKKVQGFILYDWIVKSGFWHVKSASNLIQDLMSSHSFETKIRQTAGLDSWKSALQAYSTEMTAGKVILTPWK